jgi:hypothetical protein
MTQPGQGAPTETPPSEPNQTNYQPDQELLADNERRRELFRQKLNTHRPSMDTLAEIEEQVLQVRESDSGTTTPYPEASRDYTTDERRTVRQSMRVRAAEADMPYIFSPLVPEDLQETAAKAHLDYVKGRISLYNLMKRTRESFPYYVATYALGGPDTSPDELLRASTDQPQLMTELLRCGRLAADRSRRDSIFYEDPTLYPAPLLEKDPFRATVFASVNRVAGDALAHYPDTDSLRVYNDHNEAMVGLREAGYLFEPQKESRAFDYFNATGNWLRYPKVAEIKKGLEQDGLKDRAFKLHLMPSIPEMAGVAKDLLELFKEDEALASSLEAFKVTNMPEINLASETYPTPEIVIYPFENVRSISTVLTALRKYCAGRQGRGITPRFNVPVDGSSILYMAEGQGQEKRMQAVLNTEDFDQTYDPEQNHAFRIEDQALVREIMELSDQRLAS